MQKLTKNKETISLDFKYLKEDVSESTLMQRLRKKKRV